MSIQVSVTVDGVDYTATLEGDRVSISQSVEPLTGLADGRAYVMDSTARWTGETIETFADLPDEVMDALDAELEAVCDSHRASLLSNATWRFQSSPTTDDERAVGCDLVAEGTVLASCLWAGGELDTESDGCGLSSAFRALGGTRDEIEWPSEDEALRAVWGSESAATPAIGA